MQQYQVQTRDHDQPIFSWYKQSNNAGINIIVYQKKETNQLKCLMEGNYNKYTKPYRKLISKHKSN